MLALRRKSGQAQLTCNNHRCIHLFERECASVFERGIGPIDDLQRVRGRRIETGVREEHDLYDEALASYGKLMSALHAHRGRGVRHGIRRVNLLYLLSGGPTIQTYCIQRTTSLLKSNIGQRHRSNFGQTEVISILRKHCVRVSGAHLGGISQPHWPSLWSR